MKCFIGGKIMNEEEDPKKINIKQYMIKAPSDDKSEEALESLDKDVDEILNNLRKKRTPRL
jgi:hypothetical protein